MGDRIKVLHVIKSLGRGGAEMLLPETLKFHDKSRFEFHYIYFLPWKNQMVAAIDGNGGIVSCIPASNNAQILWKWRAVARFAAEHKIQVIHAHLPWAGVVCRLIHRKMGIPTIYTEHNIQERYHFATRWMNRLTFNWQDASIAVSRDVADSIKRNISPSIPVHEVLNGVDTDQYKPDLQAGVLKRKALRLPDEAVVIGTIAVFRFQKRLDKWLEVFSAIAKRHPHVYGIMVGDGPLRRELQKKLVILGLASRVLMPGLQADVRPWLSTMDIFMMSSVFEGLPVALLEAMSMGCAVATTDAGGIKQVVEHDHNGLMVSVDDWAQLEVLVERLIQDPGLRKRLGENGRTTIKNNFGMQAMVSHLEEFYNDLADKRRNGS